MLSQNTMIYRLTLYVVFYHHNIQSVIHAEQTVAFNIHALYQMLLYFALHYVYYILHVISKCHGILHGIICCFVSSQYTISDSC